MVDQPVTNICIISDRKNCPPRYTILDRTQDNDDADFWKDSFFKNKVTRYICYTKEADNNQMNQVLTDLALIGVKDPIPQSYTAISTTADTREQGLRKHVLCARYVMKNMTSSAIVDITLFKDDSYKQRMYSLVGEMNGIFLTFKLSPIVMAVSRPAPPPPVIARQAPLTSPSPVAATQNHGDLYENVQFAAQNSSKPMTGIEGVPFKLHDRFSKPSSGNSNSSDALNITIRSLAELTRLTEYDFSQEKNIVRSVGS